MTAVKLLSIGLVAIAMLTSSAVAGQSRVKIRVSPMRLPAEPGGRWIIWGGIPIWFGPSVRGWPGHICDEGDNARIC